MRERKVREKVTEKVTEKKYRIVESYRQIMSIITKLNIEDEAVIK